MRKEKQVCYYQFVLYLIYNIFSSNVLDNTTNEITKGKIRLSKGKKMTKFRC